MNKIGENCHFCSKQSPCWRTCCLSSLQMKGRCFCLTVQFFGLFQIESQNLKVILWLFFNTYISLIFLALLCLTLRNVVSNCDNSRLFCLVQDLPGIPLVSDIKHAHLGQMFLELIYHRKQTFLLSHFNREMDIV